MHGGLQVTPQPVHYTESQSDYILPARQHNEVLTPILGEFLYFDADLFIFYLILNNRNHRLQLLGYERIEAHS